ncbi:MAG: S8 family serine peptidase, partial [Ilumatobacteraceae bacterium]
MIRTSRRTILAGAIATVSVLAAVLSPLATDAAPPSQTDSKKQLGVDQAMALVMLTNEPVTTSTKVDRGSRDRVKLDGTKTKSYRAQLADQRNVFKEWLRVNAPKARLVKGYDIALHAVTVQLNGETLETIRRSDMVRAAQFINLYGKTAVAPVDPDLALINAVQAWGIGGSANAGAGVKVGIVDSGIQQDHPCFDDLGDSDGANNFTNNKVIIAKVFSNKAKQMGWTAEAVDSHGTHVAGTVACDFGTTAVVDGVTIPHKISGVAPAAKLGNYNVFPCTLEGARSEDILDALEA